jgi:hypothetical protein
MKKSDMVKIMTNAYLNTYRGGNSEMSEEERMHYLLNIVQEYGMLPPIKKHCPVLLTTSYGWENENDV